MSTRWLSGPVQVKSRPARQPPAAPSVPPAASCWGLNHEHPCQAASSVQWPGDPASPATRFMLSHFFRLFREKPAATLPPARSTAVAWGQKHRASQTPWAQSRIQLAACIIEVKVRLVRSQKQLKSLLEGPKPSTGCILDTTFPAFPSCIPGTVHPLCPPPPTTRPVFARTAGSATRRLPPHPLRPRYPTPLFP